MSGGYAGAKATVRFITSYAGDESRRAGLGITFVSVLPQLTPATDLGARAVAAYAERQGVDIDTFVKSRGPTLTPEQVGQSILEIATAHGGTTTLTHTHICGPGAVGLRAPAREFTAAY
jgi:hypothetical protein